MDVVTEGLLFEASVLTGGGGAEDESEDEAAGFSLEDEEELLEQAARVPARASVARAAPTRNRERFM